MNADVNLEGAVVYAWHYLHNTRQGKVPIDWVNVARATVDLPDLLGVEHVYVLERDRRERRTLVVFDGHIPWGGLPKGSSVIFADRLGEVTAAATPVRQQRIEEEACVHRFSERNGRTYAVLDLWRYFVLLPSSRALVRRYHSESLAPQYLFIEVKKGMVTWHTSSS